MKIEQRCEAIELVLADVDGVLTDGGILFDNQGIESKQFHIRGICVIERNLDDRMALIMSKFRRSLIGRPRRNEWNAG